MKKLNGPPIRKNLHWQSKVGISLSLAFFASLSTSRSFAQTQVGNYASHAASGKSVVITGATGETIRVTPYGDYIVRVQVAKKGETFYADDRYEIVERHDFTGALTAEDTAAALNLSTAAADGVSIAIAKTPLRFAFSLKGQTTPVLSEKNGVTWSGNTVTESFTPGTTEHFSGLGHEAYGKISKLDRAGTSLKVSRGNEGALIVPFFVSSNGYGVLLNTTFTHTINLGQSSTFALTIDGEGYGGQMDYFFIAGPKLTDVVDRYTQLTGRPRMPQKSLFGLLLSDKSDPDNSGEAWWKKAITDHRAAGYAFDHQVNDNSWRASNDASSGQMNSWFEWRKDRYPDPAEYKKWCDDNGVTVTLDLNRPGIPLNASWKTEYGMPGTTGCPDFTNLATRKWIWQLFFTMSLDPALKYPGDAIWLDEFDYPDQVHSMTLASGKRWAEESINYHLDLQKACVKEGWDVGIGEAKRPYFWSRGATAGAQRWSAYWTGDLDGNYTVMADQVRAMQSAGISGFPYFNHDAGAHFNLTVNEDNIYRQWDMAFGSFTPIWKPHGPAYKRWPLQRNATCQATAKTFITNRYQMIPYIYSYARIAQATGIPMARPMFLEDQTNTTAWQKDLQYMWGKEMLVAPNCTDTSTSVSVWLPKGNWYYFWDDKKFAGDKTENVTAAIGVIPVFVKEGAIIPMAPFAKSTFFIPKDQLVLHVYVGADGTFQLFEDDGVSEKFRTKSESRLTDLRFTQADLGVEVAAAKGTFASAPTARTYQVVYHGLADTTPLFLNTTPITAYTAVASIPANQNGAVWDATQKLLTVYLASQPVANTFRISNSANAVTPTGGAIATGGALASDGGILAGTGGAGGAGGNATGGSTSNDASASSGGSIIVVTGGAGGSALGGTIVSPTGGAGGNSNGGAIVSTTGGVGGGSVSGGITGGTGGNAAGGSKPTGSGGNGATGGSAPVTKGTSSGCSCRIDDTRDSSKAWPVLGFLAVFLLRRRSLRQREKHR